jgi:hypothetical protein
MEREHWTSEEAAKLRKLRIDPVKNPLKKLIPVVEHFLKGDSVWAITQAGAGDLRISGSLARKVRDGVASGDLDFIVQLIRKPPPPGATAIRDESSDAVRMTQLADMERHLQEIREFTETMKESLEIQELRLVGLRPSVPGSTGRRGGAVRRPRLEKHLLHRALRQHVKGEKLGSLLEEHDRSVEQITTTSGALMAEAEDWVRSQGLAEISPQDLQIEKVGVLQEFGATAVVNALKDVRHGVWTEMPYVIQGDASLEMEIRRSRGDAASKDHERQALRRNLTDRELTEVFWWCIICWTDESGSVRIGAGEGVDLVKIRRAHVQLRKQLAQHPVLPALVDMLRSRERLCSRIAGELERLKHVVAFPGSCDLCRTRSLSS